jgi:hypothetical protein
LRGEHKGQYVCCWNGTSTVAHLPRGETAQHHARGLKYALRDVHGQSRRRLEPAHEPLDFAPPAVAVSRRHRSGTHTIIDGSGTATQRKVSLQALELNCAYYTTHRICPNFRKRFPSK